MAKLHEDLRNGYFKDIKFDLCPANISLPEDLYKYATDIKTDGTTDNDARKDFLKDTSYKYDEESKLNIFSWGTESIFVSKDVSEKIIKMIFFNTFASPEINAHSYQFFQVEPGDVVIDGGGYEGFYTMDCLNKGAGHVMVFEPLVTLHEILRKNFKSEDKVSLYLALGIFNGHANLHIIGEGSAIHGKMQGHGRQIPMEVRTLDSILNKRGDIAVDIIKLDVEGSEFDTLIGAKDTIRRFKPKLIIGTYHRYMDAFLIYRFLTSIRPDYNILLWGRWYGNMVRDEIHKPCKPYMLVAW